jgi:Skp family chaperone for outer membrane proteins
MTRKHISVLAAVLALAGASLSGAQTVPSASRAAGTPSVAPAAPAPTKLAVVNLVQLFNDLLERRDNETTLDNMRRGFEEDNRKLQDALKDMDKNLSSFGVGTPEYKKAQDDYLKKGMELQSFGSFAQQKLFIEQRLYTTTLYRKINDAIAKYAAANGIAIVFVADSANVERATTPEGLQAAINTRKILYADASFDITAKITQTMNTEYNTSRTPTP